MRKRLSIEFHESKEVNAPVLKFGGEPFGLPTELWPTSRNTSHPMQFICQVPLDPRLFPTARESVAYLFMTEPEHEQETWDPDSGENALIILPREKLTDSLTVGDAPRLVTMQKKLLSKQLHPTAIVYAATLSPGEDPDFVPDHARAAMTAEQREAHWNALQGNKIGGSPAFIQSDELPFDEWHLLLQLDSTVTPFWINFGDAGIGYAFLNADCTKGKFLWQCS